MKQRCSNPNHTAARWYHDKGIRVCNEWLNFETFQEWALKNGYREDLSIDRIDSDKNYCPDNCQWIPLKENVLKRRNFRGGIRNIPKYRVWECTDNGKKIRIVGEFYYKRDAEKAADAELSKAREETIKDAIKNNREQGVIDRIKKKKVMG